MTAPNTPLGSFLEGLTGGVEQGYQFRTGIQDRKRRILSEDEQAQYERAKQLREAVGFQLQQRVGESNLATAEATRANLTADNERADRAAVLTTYQTMFPTARPVTPAYVQEGFDKLHPNDPVAAQRAWQNYHRAISRAGQPNAANEKLQFGVAGGIEAIKGILEHYKADPSSIRTPVGAQWAESLAGVHVPGFGSPFEGLAESSRQHAMTPRQSEVADLYEALAHNTAGLLPNKGLAIFRSLRDVYRSKAGSSTDTDQFKVTLLQRLQRRLEQLQRGEKVTDADFQSDLDSVSPVPNLLRRSTDQQPPEKRADPRKFFRP